MPEILDFIRSKIPRKEISPTRNQIRSMIDFDPEHLKRDAIIEHLLDQVDDLMEIIDDDQMNLDGDTMGDEIDLRAPRLTRYRK
jgi:hypothetical protein